MIMNAAKLLLASYYPAFLMPYRYEPKVQHRRKLPDAGGLKVRHGKLEARGFGPKFIKARP